MALPKVKSPTHELTIPSTGKALKYRPFLVKEQKILLMALESQDQGEMVRAIKQIITNCALEDLDVDSIPMFDLEYIFVKLRARSVGEQVQLNLRHDQGTNAAGDVCGGTFEHTLDLMDVEVKKDETHTSKIVLEEDTGIGVVLKYPTISMADEIAGAIQKSQIETITDMVISCIESIFDNENVYPASESTVEEITTFLNDLSQDQFSKVTDFFTTMPKLSHDIEWVCPVCGETSTNTLEGMANFFG
jgi:hypothetical protein